MDSNQYGREQDLCAAYVLYLFSGVSCCPEIALNDGGCALSEISTTDAFVRTGYMYQGLLEFD